MILLLGLAAVAPGAKAQGAIGDTTTTPIAGAPHDYITGLNEIVNPANGALSIRIGQPVPHERGQNWPAYAFVYDSNGFYSLLPGWTTNTNGTPTTFLTQLQLGAFSATAKPNTVTYILNYLSDCVSNGSTCLLFQCTERTGYVYGDPDGGQHGLGIQYGLPTTHVTSNDCDHFSVHSYYLGGDDRFKASMDQNTYVVTVTDLHGNNPVTEDANGNFHNTTNRTASVPARSTLQTETINQSTAALNITSNSKSTYCNLTSISKFAATSIVTKSVTLPNGEQYTFQYDPVFGLINKITYPTGATVTYTWSVIPDSQGARYSTIVLNSAGGNCSLHYDWFAITKRVVSYDGTTNAQEQDFSYTTTWPTLQSYQWTTKTTTVTTKDLLRGTNFNTVYTYSPMLPPAESDYPLADLGYVPVENTVQYKGTDGSLLKTVTKVWTTMSNLAAECETLPNGQTSGKFYVYQPYTGFGPGGPFNSDAYKTNLPTDVAEYDFGQVSSACVQPTSSVLPIRETATAYQVFPNSPISVLNSIQDRPSSVKVFGVVAGAKALLAETDYVYDGSTPSAVSPVPYGHDEANFGSGSTAPRGNPTTTTKKCFVGATSCTNSVATYIYDTTGQVLSVKDANLNTTMYSYTDNYTSDDGSPANNTNAFVTKITRPTTSGVSHITSFQYGFNDGKLRLVTDENNLQTKYCYWTNGCSGASFDPFVRLTEIDRPDGGKTNETYNDPGNSPSVTTSKMINSGQSVSTTTVSDGLGHAKQTQLTSDPQGTVFTDTTYDGLGQVWKQSNPYRAGADITTTSGITTFFYDSLGRKCLVVPPDGTQPTGGTCPSTRPSNDLFTQYSGNTTTVTDQTNRSRESVTDALGRLTQVLEDPGSSPHLNYETDYQYDALGNLLCVGQKGTNSGTFSTCASIPAGWHARSFTYDSLSRLLTSNNPESGIITYTYDPNSNVLTKKDARNITTTYTYDALNREKTAGYSNGDPTVTTVYDGTNCLGLSGCQNIGHRTSMTDAAGSEIWAYQVDAANHRSLHNDQRTTDGVTKTQSYILDLAANTTQITYIGGRVVNYTFDSANRPSSANDSIYGAIVTGFKTTPGSTCLANVTCYAPQGALYAVSIGQTSTFNGLNLTHIYNTRLQPQEFKASSSGGNAIDITYSYADPLNNNQNAGHVFSTTNNLDTTRSQTFTYDQLYRITGALTTSTHATSPTHCWGETYALDAWANLNSIAATTNPAYTGCTQESGFSQTANSSNKLPNFGYDLSGNATSDSVNTYTWDAESQLKTGGGATYHYDGDGRRVSKMGSKLYWYGLGGEILAESNPSGTTTAAYIYFGGKRIAMVPAGGNPSYYVEDMLGTSRVLTTNTGIVCYDADFYPYGGERSYTNTCPQNYKFEGKERDTETGNDDFGARYYSNRFGRWLSADWSSVPVAVPYANLTNPQTLNLYSMVADDPESFADLDGHCWKWLQGVCPSHGDDQVRQNQGAQQTPQTTIKITNDSKNHTRTLTETTTSNITIQDGNGNTTATGTQTTTTSVTVSTANETNGQVLGGTQTNTLTLTDSSGQTRVSTADRDLSPLQAVQTAGAKNMGALGDSVKPTFWQGVKNHKVGTGGIVIGVGAAVGCAVTACPTWLPPAAVVVGGAAAIWDFGTHP